MCVHPVVEAELDGRPHPERDHDSSRSEIFRRRASSSLRQCLRSVGGRVTRFRLPSGSVIGIYEPRHPLAIDL